MKYVLLYGWVPPQEGRGLVDHGLLRPCFFGCPVAAEAFRFVASGYLCLPCVSVLFFFRRSRRYTVSSVLASWRSWAQ